MIIQVICEYGILYARNHNLLHDCLNKVGGRGICEADSEKIQSRENLIGMMVSTSQEYLAYGENTHTCCLQASLTQLRRVAKRSS